MHTDGRGNNAQFFQFPQFARWDDGDMPETVPLFICPSPTQKHDKILGWGGQEAAPSWILRERCPSGKEALSRTNPPPKCLNFNIYFQYRNKTHTDEEQRKIHTMQRRRRRKSRGAVSPRLTTATEARVSIAQRDSGSVSFPPFYHLLCRLCEANW